MKRLDDLPIQTLSDVLEVLGHVAEPVELVNVQDLSSDEARLALAYRVGRNSIAKDFHAAIQRLKNEASGHGSPGSVGSERQYGR